jgi:hypothetical protein
VARTSSSERLKDRLGLTDEELLEILGSSPLELLARDDDEREDLRVLLGLTEGVDGELLRTWVRGRPLELLLRRDFPAFEAAVEELKERGWVIRRR